MSHARTSIRKAVVAALQATATAGGNVIDGRTDKLTPQDLPALKVSVREQVEPMGSIGRFEQRNVDIFVQIFARNSEFVSDTLDDVSAEVELAVVGAGTLGGVVKGAPAFVSYEPLFAPGDAPLGEAVMRFTAMYVTQAGQPGVNL